MPLVLGGGIGGLAAAYYLTKGGQNVTLIEAGKRLGGWIRTIKDPKTGVNFDKGPRTLRVKGESGINTLNLIEELGLNDKLVPITMNQPSARNRMIFVNNQLHLLPSSVSSIFKKTAPFSKPLFTTVFKDLMAPAKKTHDDSIYDFVERRFGNEVADYLVSAMICGICAGDAKEISVKFLMPHLFDMEQKHRSVLIGMLKTINSQTPKSTSYHGDLYKKAVKENWNIFGFEGGMETFPLALHEKLISCGVDIKLETQVSQLYFQNSLATCKIGDDELSGNHIISCLPANKLGSLLKEQHPALSEELLSTSYVDVAVVNLAYQGKVLKKDAFGFLIPPSQKNPILGVIFDSCNFKSDNWTILTVMMGGAWFKDYFEPNVSEEELLNLAISKIKSILNIDVPPSASHVAVMKDCIPQYVIGHYDKIERIKSYINENQLPLSLVGSSYAGVGVNDVILLAKKAADSCLKL